LIKGLSLFLCLIFCLSAFADRVIIDAPEGGIYRITWPDDGRVAEIKRSYNSSGYLNISFEPIQSDCEFLNIHSPIIYKPNYREDFIAAIWVENPVDPSRVGKIVERSLGFDYKPVFLKIEATWNHREKFPSLFSEMGPSLLEFEAPEQESLQIQDWHSERMIRNPETGVDENTIVSGAYGMLLEKFDLGFQITDPGYIYSRSNNSEWPMLGDVVSWQMVSNDDSCTIAFSPKLSELSEELQYYRNQIDPYYTEFRWGNPISDYIETSRRNFIEFGQNFPVRVR